MNPGLKIDPDQVVADLGAARGERLVRFAWAAPDTTFALIRVERAAAAGRCSTVMPSRSMLYESGNITIYLRVGRDGRLLMGGRRRQRPVSDASHLRYLSATRTASGPSSAA